MTPETIFMLALLAAVAVFFSTLGRPARKSGWKWRGKWRKKKHEARQSESAIDGDEVAEYEIAEFRKHVKSKKYLMTYTENAFFRGLLVAAEARDLLVFTKVRLVDLVDIDEDYGRSQQIFRKLVSKHLDFVLADGAGRPIACIELDDYRHETKNRNDAIKDELMKACRISFVRVKVAKEYDYDGIFDSIPLREPVEPAPEPMRVTERVPDIEADDWKRAGDKFRPSWQK